jgi:predicted helicase
LRGSPLKNVQLLLTLDQLKVINIFAKALGDRGNMVGECGTGKTWLSFLTNL